MKLVNSLGKYKYNSLYKSNNSSGASWCYTRSLLKSEISFNEQTWPCKLVRMLVKLFYNSF